MKLKLVVVDLELTRRQKIGICAGLIGCLTAVAAVAMAVPNQFTKGETLTATDLNANFSDLDQRVATVDQGLTTNSQNLASATQQLTTMSQQVTSTTQAVSTLTQEVTADTQGLAAANQGLTSRLEAEDVTVSALTGSLNAATTQAKWQSASSVVTTNASGDATVNYPVAFANGLLNVMVVNGDVVAGGFRVGGISGSSKTGFSARVYGSDGNVLGAGWNVRLNWIAIGW